MPSVDWIGVCAATVSWLLFANTWNGDFVYDDRWALSSSISLTIFIHSFRSLINKTLACAICAEPL